MMFPSRDPNCQKYIDDPNLTWYGGKWRTLEGVERERERLRKRYANDPEYRERQREMKRKRYANDPEYRECQRKRYANDPEYRERQLEYKREHRRKHPEKHSASNARRIYVGKVYAGMV